MHMHQEIQTLQKEPSIFGNGSEWPYGWVFVYELSVSGFESSCSHLNCSSLPLSFEIANHVLAHVTRAIFHADGLQHDDSN